MMNNKELMNEIGSLQKILEQYYLNLGQEMNSWLQCVAICSLNNKDINDLVEIITVDDSDSCQKRQRTIAEYDDKMTSVKNDLKKIMLKNTHISDALRDFQKLADEMAKQSMDLIARVVQDGEEVGVVSFLERLRQSATSCVNLGAQSLNQCEKNRGLFHEQNQLCQMIHKGNRHWESLEKRLVQSRKELYQQADAFREFFESLIEEGQIMKTPILEILEVVQNQDLFRQSLDHVNLLLADRYFLQDRVKGATDNDLDKLVFTESVCLFSESLFGELSERLRNDLEVIETRMESLQTYLKGLESRVNLFFIEEKGDKPLSPGLLNAYNERSEVEKTFRELLKQQILYQTRLKMESSRLNSLSSLDDLLQEMQEKVTQLYPLLRLGSKIARSYSRLDGEVSFLKNMRKLLDKMQRRILRAIRFRGEINQLIDKNRISTESLPALDDLYVNDQNFQDISKQLFDILARRQSDMCVSFNNCFITVKETKDVSDFLKDETTHFQKLLAVFKEIQQLFLAEKEKVFQTRNIEEWKIKEKRIIDKLDQFTIHRQKKSFSDLAGLDESHMAFKEGSVIMF